MHSCLLVLTWLFAFINSWQLCFSACELVNPLSSMDEGRAHKGSPITEGILAISVYQERDSGWPLVEGLRSSG